MSSMRSRGGAAGARRPRVGVRPVYEDFKPMSEWKHEKGVDSLLYHLPGFVKEQIRIIAESKGILRVHGERLVEGNKWSRFQEEVVVPEGCNLSEIRAKFEDGTLRIIMPNKNLKVENNQHTVEKEVNKIRDPPASSATPSSFMHQKPQEPKVNLPSTPTLPNNNAEKSPITANVPQHLGPLNNVSEPQHKELHDATNIDSKKVTHEEISTNLNKNNEINKQKYKMNDGVGDRKKDNIVDKINESQGFSNLKNLAKGHIPRRLDEDRQLLMNMGAAILVIMALGASITYSLGLGD
ncbi:uncharacterized protein LOC141645811 [Silene latifolia]|uniref:uncharacterized protein LOC141645811 n=1 Tax=Silene latifolia TaxID=37657 RepID=UPI003D77A33C